MAGDDEKPRLPSIEEEFAELDRELKRLSALPLETPEQRNSLLLTLQGMRQQLEESGKRPDAPAWRRAIDASLVRALDGMMTDLARDTDSSGQVRFDPTLLQRHLEPVFHELADGLRRNLVEKFGQKRAPGAPPIKVDGADLAGILLTLFGPQKKK